MSKAVTQIMGLSARISLNFRIMRKTWSWTNTWAIKAITRRRLLLWNKKREENHQRGQAHKDLVEPDNNNQQEKRRTPELSKASITTIIHNPVQIALITPKITILRAEDRWITGARQRLLWKMEPKIKSAIIRNSQMTIFLQANSRKIEAKKVHLTN